ncbi:MAG: hypothetical protein PHT59_07215, partial [Candidatus Omnitrophica bacterium]|nr:hypothetical protein [Candidatus Omnitrophota bacterium]
MKRRLLADKLSVGTGSFKFSLKAYPVFLYVVVALLLFAFSWLVRVNLAVPLFLLCLIGYLKFLHRELGHPINLLNVSFLYVIIIAASYGVLVNDLPVFFIPFALVSMLSALLFSDRIVTFVLTVASAVTVAYFTPEPRHVSLLFLTSGMLSGILVFDARRRNTIINTGVLVGVVQSLTYALIKHFHFVNPDQLL